MPGDTCIVCGNTRAKDPSVSMHRFPQDKTKRLRWTWLQTLGLKDDHVRRHHRVCSRHFPEGNAKSHDPQLILGKRFASPKKRWTNGAKRAKRRPQCLRSWCFIDWNSNYLVRHSSGTVQTNDLVLAAAWTLDIVWFSVLCLIRIYRSHQRLCMYQ